MRMHAGRAHDQYAPAGSESSGVCFSQRIVCAALLSCDPAQPAAVHDAGLVLLCALDGPLWPTLLAIVPGDALRLVELLAQMRWPAELAAKDEGMGLQPVSSYLMIGERLLYSFMEHVCALHRRACVDGDASSSQLLLLPLLTASELRQEGFECAAVFYASAHRLSSES